MCYKLILRNGKVTVVVQTSSAWCCPPAASRNEWVGKAKQGKVGEIPVPFLPYSSISSHFSSPLWIQWAGWAIINIFPSACLGFSWTFIIWFCSVFWEEFLFCSLQCEDPARVALSLLPSMAGVWWRRTDSSSLSISVCCSWFSRLDHSCHQVLCF